MTDAARIPQEPRLVKRTDMTGDSSLPKAEQAGYLRTMYHGVQANNCMANLIHILSGQKTPRHVVNADHIIVQLEGQVEFSFDNESHRLEPHDMLFFPADLPYAYANVGDTDAVFVSIVAKVSDWPAEATYWD